MSRRGEAVAPGWAAARAVAVLLALLGGAGCRPGLGGPLPQAAIATPSGDGGEATAADVDRADGGAPPAATEAPDTTEAPDAGAGLVEAPAPPATVRVAVRSVPRASVQWGRKNLGTTPVVVERPRESGPMDLVLRAQGYLPFHTRAYTFKNDSLSIELVRIDKKDTLLGARKAPPAPPDGGAAGPGGGPDGGVR